MGGIIGGVMASAKTRTKRMKENRAPKPRKTRVKTGKNIPAIYITISWF
jgi:hypothetical protein